MIQTISTWQRWLLTTSFTQFQAFQAKLLTWYHVWSDWWWVLHLLSYLQNLIFNLLQIFYGFGTVWVGGGHRLQELFPGDEKEGRSLYFNIGFTRRLCFLCLSEVCWTLVQCSHDMFNQSVQFNLWHTSWLEGFQVWPPTWRERYSMQQCPLGPHQHPVKVKTRSKVNKRSKTVLN